MAIIPMQKVRLYVTSKDALVLVSELQKLGYFALSLDNEQTKDLANNDQQSYEKQHEQNKLDMAIHFLSRYHKVDFFRKTFEGGRVYTSHRELNELAEKNDGEAIIARVISLQDSLVRNRKFQEDLDKELHAFEIKHRSEVARAEEDELPDPSVPVESITALEENITRIKEAKARAVTEEAEIEAEVTKVATAELNTLKKLSDIALWQSQQERVAQIAPSTVSVKVFTGWIPLDKQTELENHLQKIVPTTALELIAPEANEVPPTELRNNKFLSPFEAVTRLYGVPHHKDLDPSPFLAAFFVIFFSMCLSDVGYGVILATSTGFILYKYRVDRGMRQMLSLLMYGGIGSAIAGVFFGGYLGVSPADIHPKLAELVIFDSVSNPIPVIALSLVLGFIHIAFGIALNLWRQIKLKQTLEGILTSGPWLFFFLVFAVIGVAMTGLIPEVVSSFILANTTYMLILAAALVVLTQGRDKKSFIAKAVFGVLSLYSLVNYFADLMSYTRLLALGLATSALAFSFNLIAEFIGGSVPYIGWLVMGLILLFGHTLNIALSTLGAFINSARLQFVEFFGKFSTASGVPFVTLEQTERHVIIVQDQKLKS